MKKLYEAEIIYKLVIVADDETEAETEAIHACIEEYPSDVYIKEMTKLPYGWDTGCIPYGYRDEKDRDRTIKGWIALEAAPNFKE